MCRGLIVLGQISVVPGGSFQCFYSVILFLESFLRIALKTLFCYSVLIFFFLLRTSNTCMLDLPAYFPFHLLSLTHFLFISPHFFPCFSSMLYIIFIWICSFWEHLIIQYSFLMTFFLLFSSRVHSILILLLDFYFFIVVFLYFWFKGRFKKIYLQMFMRGFFTVPYVLL